MSFDLSAHLFYGFKLVESENGNDALRQPVYMGDLDDWDGNPNKLVCATVITGWGDPVVHSIAIKSSIRKAQGGELTPITIPRIEPVWNDLLKDWCKVYGFEYGEPSWQLAALYL